MRAVNILITGVGAIIGQGIVKSLRMKDQPVRVIGVDRNPQAFGARRCDAFYAKPDDETGSSYLSFWKELVQKEKVDLIIPGIEPDVLYFNRHRREFAGLDVALAVNRASLIETAGDKWVMQQALHGHGIEPIPTTLFASWDECLRLLGRPPFLMKPVQGSGAKGIVFLEDEADFAYWQVKCGQRSIIQRIVGTDEEEYTVAVFGFGDGNAVAPVVLRRTLSDSGATQNAEVVIGDVALERATARLNQAFQPLGPTNYQFRKDGDKVYLLEINPRISSATSLRAAFNYNEAWMCVDYFVYGVRPQAAEIRRGRAVRYVEDCVDYL